ncbi:hypothetical protein E4656_09710 [Natronospirillum operosum]|uniref:Anti-sigma factor n=1 Tax=Natronospirillum operosum TaxID=2759953 RepID=A0A4Z0WEG2_9GAMM|nr:hypothetical protein [Natronospirillum operosum]TGG93321.1 hypothetical protein E4656_09710 [Natronospirillum operosum]
MSGILRYSLPAVREHLARQYVAGDLHPLARRRMERLLASDASLQQAVEYWADTLYPLQQGLPEAKPPAFVWRRIEQAIDHARPAAQSADAGSSPSVPAGMLLFKWLAAVSTTIAVGLALLLLRPSEAPEIRNPAYLAPLSHRDTVTLVLYGFARTEQAAPELRLQWARTYHPRPEGELHLWAELAATGEWHYLGELPPDREQLPLAGRDWEVLTASRRLLVSRSNRPQDWTQVVMAGPCIQLYSEDTVDNQSSPASHAHSAGARASGGVRAAVAATAVGQRLGQ